jgi:hypothetical protein
MKTPKSVKPSASYSLSLIHIAHHQYDVLSTLLRTINEFFPLPEKDYLSKDMNTYRGIMLDAQEQLTQDEMPETILSAIRHDLSDYMGTEDLLIQNNLYLRASRPHLPTDQENIDWHREPFYGPNLENSVNIWTPIRGVCEKNTLRYVPESQRIPCETIQTVNVGSKSTARYSVGHKLGFNYDPKKIVSGVDFSLAEPLLVPLGASAIFPGMLIHGAAANYATEIRFSVDFQVMAKKHYKSSNKKYHFSSGKPYFRELLLGGVT